VIARPQLEQRIHQAVKRSQVTTLLGPRQCGKTTLARDSGLLHHLLGIHDEGELERHPKVGASWEGYVIEEILKATEIHEAYFWATHQGAELDLLLVKHGRLYGVECKRVDAPKLTPSMRIALTDLKLERLAVVYPGPQRYKIAPHIEAVPLEAVLDGFPGLFPKKLAD
jgi:predicted AAA+ superfamily ATPase